MDSSMATFTPPPSMKDDEVRNEVVQDVAQEVSKSPISSRIKF
jgi:hypothetical protein